jgi:hypothetical protein
MADAKIAAFKAGVQAEVAARVNYELAGKAPSNGVDPEIKSLLGAATNAFVKLASVNKNHGVQDNGFCQTCKVSTGNILNKGQATHNTPPSADDKTPPSADNKTPPSAYDKTPPSGNTAKNTKSTVDKTPPSGNTAKDNEDTETDPAASSIWTTFMGYASNLIYIVGWVTVVTLFLCRVHNSL